MPYQFPSAVDPRVSGISTRVGKKFTENIMLEAPVCTIIPGEPKYLPGSSKTKQITTASALLEAQGGNFSALDTVLKGNKKENMRLYDFANNYTEYMKYVNVLCRAGATFLGLDETIYAGSKEYSFQRYDWRNYRWNVNANQSLTKKTKSVVSNLFGKNDKSSKSKKFKMGVEDGKEGSLKEVLTNYNYVQFYVDPDVSPSESLQNSTGESSMKSLLDNGSSLMKEVAFWANSGGIDTKAFETFSTESLAALQSGVNGILGQNTASGVLSRIINLGGSALKGHNIVIPDVYQNSQYSKSYSITVHLKAPYGTVLGYYMDIFVPMMHLLALAMPKQESANSFSSPFLVKAYVEGVFSCNLGIVDSININKVAESWSVNGLPSEVDVTLNITDLYSDLTMTPSSAPKNFINNSSLIEYIATNCGMSLTAPNFEKKFSNIINTVVSAFTDIPGSIKGAIEEKIQSFISGITSLY